MTYEAMHRCENCDAYEWESPSGEPGSKPTTIVGHMNGAIKDLAERVAKLESATPARALPDDDEPTIGDLQRELARLRLSRDTWKTRAQKAARRLIDALPDHASCASAELLAK